MNALEVFAPILFWLSVGLIFYTYLGYPLLVVILAQFRQKPVFDFNHSATATLPTITLLIAAYNEEAVISQKLENTLDLDYPPEKLQILVAADGSDDETPVIVKAYADKDIELSYHPERRGKMAAINRAMEQAKGELIVFSDANNFYSPLTLRALVTPFSDKKVGGTVGAKTIISGDSFVGESEGYYWKYESFLKKQETRLGCCTSSAGEIFAMRRVLFVRPPEEIINDDFYLMTQIIRQGYNVVYVPAARSYERASFSAGDEIQRRARIVAGRYQAMRLGLGLLPWKRPFVTWQLISHKYLRPLVPLAMIGGFVSALLVVLFPLYQGNPFWTLRPPYGAIALIGQIFFYLVACLGYFINDSHPLGKLYYVPKFFVDSNFAALIGFFRFLFGKQTTLWKRAERRKIDTYK